MELTKRVSIKEIEPEAYEAMMALEHYCETIQVDPKLRELVKIRASQINGCAYCIDLHAEKALNLGESERRIFALTAWKESHLFTEEERVVLQLTDEITGISLQGVTDGTYRNVMEFYGEKTMAQLIMLIVLINSWNRVAVATRMIYSPEIAQ